LHPLIHLERAARFIPREICLVKSCGRQRGCRQTYAVPPRPGGLFWCFRTFCLWARASSPHEFNGSHLAPQSRALTGHPVFAKIAKRFQWCLTTTCAVGSRQLSRSVTASLRLSRGISCACRPFGSRNVPSGQRTGKLKLFNALMTSPRPLGASERARSRPRPFCEPSHGQTPKTAVAADAARRSYPTVMVPFVSLGTVTRPLGGLWATKTRTKDGRADIQIPGGPLQPTP
jgi:hypothetical protein